MRIKSLRTGNIVDVERKVGEALVALGDAEEVIPAQPPKPASANTGEAAFDSERIASAAAKRLPFGTVRRTFSTGLSLEQERALDTRTAKYRAPLNRQDTEITIGALCAFLGVAVVELRDMSDARLDYLCNTVPPVPTAVDGSEWGQPAFRYAEFLQRGETWLGFLRRLRVTWTQLRTWERCQVERRARTLFHEPVKAGVELPKEQTEHTPIEPGIQHRYV
jgi:hypothetical protein